MEPFETVMLDLLLEALRNASEEELRLLVAALAVADPPFVSQALVWVAGVADSVSEPPVG
jgi:hypothetical protein